MLAVDVFVDGVTGLVTIEDASGLVGGDASEESNVVTLSLNNRDPDGAGGADEQDGLLVTDPDGAIALGTGIVQVSPTEVFVPGDFDFDPGVGVDLRDVLTDEINVFLQAGDDSLEVEADGVDILHHFFFYDGGSGSDLLTFSGTPEFNVDETTYTPGIQADEGRIAFDDGVDPPMTFDFDNLEPVVNLIPAASLVVNADGGANSITYSAGSVNARGLVAIDGNETLEFENQANLTLNGLAGNDTIVANNPNTPTGLLTLTINAGLGNDEIRFESLPAGLNGAAASGGAGDDVVDASLLASTVPLTLRGNAGNDTLTGGAGADVLQGGADDDTLVDSPLADTFIGGTGNDSLVIAGTILNDTIDVFQNAPSAIPADNYTLDVSNGGFAVDQIGKTNGAQAPNNAANLPDIERIVVEGLVGDDAIRAGHAHFYGDGDLANGVAAQSIRFDVRGDGPNASDRLIVRDDLVGDTVIQRQGPDGRSGSVTVGTLAPVDYSQMEFVDVAPLNPIVGGTGSDNNGRLVVFKNDPFESNNILPNATFLGAGPTVNVDPTIDPAGIAAFNIPGDADFYQFVAQETGTLDFQLYFEPVGTLANGQPGLPGGGELNATVFDNDGAPLAGIGASGPLNIIDGAGAKIGERITVPVVRNQTYFVRIQGDTAADINVYNFTAITTAAPVPELVDLQAASDSGRNNTDDITNITTPTFNIILDDDRIDAFANVDLLPDTVDDNLQTAAFDYGVQMFNNGAPIGFAFYTGVGNTWQFTAAAGDLNQGDFNHISAAVWVRDRAAPATIGRHDLSPSLQVTLDTVAPPVSFGQATAISAADGLFDGSDTGTANNGASFGDRITSDTTPTLWGRAEADSIVTLYLDTNGNGTIQPGTDFFLGQTVAVPLDGNNAFPGGYWEITSAVDLNLAALGFGRDGARPLLVTAQDVAGNPVPAGVPPTIGAAFIDALTIFLDTQGPQITGVSVNTLPTAPFGGYNLFDAKPSVNGHSPLVSSLTVHFADLPPRADVAGTINDFIYPALDPTVAGTIGNYAVIGDHVGPVVITAATVNQAVRFSGTVTAAAAAAATTVTDAGLAGVPAVGDFIVFNNGAAAGLTRRVTAFAAGVITLDAPLNAAQAVGDGFSIVSAASMLHAGANVANTMAQATVTSTANTVNTFTAAGLAGGAAVGDYVRFNTTGTASAGNLGQIRRVTNVVGNTITVGGFPNLAVGGFPTAPAAGDSFTLIDSNNTIGITALNTASVTLTFATPLPDDRFRVAVSENLVDPAGNKLDGESNAAEPTAAPTFPTGDGIPGGPFLARFTVDSRPEIGSYVSQNINIDINGNMVWDPANDQIGNDATNVDLSFAMDAFNNGALIPGGLSPHDLVVAGRFTPVGFTAPPVLLFDQLATYGNYNGTFRWLIDFDSDGAVYGNGDPDGVNDLIVDQAPIAGFNIAGAVPVAGDFDANPANGDEIGLYFAGQWAIDTTHNFVLDTVVNGNMFGHPIVGDFDGNGEDDLGVFNNNQFFFDLNVAGFDGNFENANTITWGYPGVLDRPVAADMDQDGIDDIGLWDPGNTAQDNREIAEWRFLISGDPTGVARVAGAVNTLNHAFNPVPFGNDLYAEFGDELALPIVGNFDPPVAAQVVGETPITPQTRVASADFDSNGFTGGADLLRWQRGMSLDASAGSARLGHGDGNGDGAVDQDDLAVWAEDFGSELPTSLPVADFNGSGEIGGDDLGVWESSFSSGGFTGSSLIAWQRAANHQDAPVAAAATTPTFSGLAGLPLEGLLEAADDALEQLALNEVDEGLGDTGEPPAFEYRSAYDVVFSSLSNLGSVTDADQPDADQQNDDPPGSELGLEDDLLAI